MSAIIKTMQRPLLTFANFVPTPQNHSALLAVRGAAEAVCSGQRHPQTNPLFLHGPPGTGKTHLVRALIEEVTRRCPDRVVALVAAGDLGPAPAEAEQGPEDPLREANQSDLLVVEDLQHLPPRATTALSRALDRLPARSRQVVCTAAVGPQHLAHRGKPFPARLTSRLAAGLVVGLQPLPAEGRLAVLEDQANRRRLAVSHEALTWLAARIGGWRELAGAVHRLEALAPSHNGPLELPVVAAQFAELDEDCGVTVERIAQRVAGYFGIKPDQIHARRRSPGVLLPRQVGMYLAHRLTDLSLKQIGAYFGGRDHSTVLHACRKIEQALVCDAVLSGAVRQLHAELS